MLPRWPTVTIAVDAGGFVAVASVAWIWSHLVQGDEFDDAPRVIGAAAGIVALGARGAAIGTS